MLKQCKTDLQIQLGDSTRRLESNPSSQSFSVKFMNLAAGEEFLFTVKSRNYKGDFCTVVPLTAYTSNYTLTS